MVAKKYKSQLVYGLDIGTRSIVGTVGYREGKKFVVVAQASIEHETRAMLDGQIHDIAAVADTIKLVTAKLEDKLDEKLTKVCIAAAGRVLKTVEVHSEIDFGEEREVKPEDVYSLHSIAIEDAYKQFLSDNNQNQRFYCVGSSVIRYYLGDYVINNLEKHKAHRIGVDLIGTFLPDEVVDGLYKSVELADLEVASMTLEPIAAIGLAIPERFRLLNIALVDVGAGTSDISITKDGSIIAYGMIPTAGDSITERIANYCMVDFNTAESIKKRISSRKKISYEDILGVKRSITREEVGSIVAEDVANMAGLVADKIIELNGDKTVGAVFVVGGGGVFQGYTEMLAQKLGLSSDRVALRGREVMSDIVFEDTELKVDSLLVTPIGIALSYYEETNSFIYVSFNEKKVKIYNSNNLTVMDVAMQTDFPSNGFFPKSGKALNYTLNGVEKMVRGELGEAAIITVNGKPAHLNTPVGENDIIEVVESTAGEEGKLIIGKLPGYKSAINLMVDGNAVKLSKFVSVNGDLKSEFYEIADGDVIEILDYYTAEQVAEFIDINFADTNCLVNNIKASPDTKVYENFTVEFKEIDFNSLEDADSEELQRFDNEEPRNIAVIVNGSPVILSGKARYIFVDIFDYIEFDRSKPQGNLVAKKNHMSAEYLEEINDNDIIEIYWEK